MKKLHIPPMHLACTIDELRPAMQYVEIKEGIATATNANILVQINLFKESSIPDEVIESLNGKYIHKNIWKRLCNVRHIEQVENDLLPCVFNEYRCSFDIRLEDGLQYPAYENVILKEVDMQPIKAIGINAEFLNTIGKILGNSKLLYTHFISETRSIYVTANEVNGFAILMPCKYQAPAKLIIKDILKY